MGRRDGVQFLLEVIAEARRILPALEVDFLDGWASRGNGTSADYEGLLVHHTAADSSERYPFPSEDVLVNGRGGSNPLPGPLCNLAGPWCTVQRPRLVVVAAHPSNNAGASGGRSMGPLPVTKLFNPKVLGLEIDYAGTRAMTAGQLLVAQVVGRAVINVLGRPSAEWVRAHYETSITGKWDIGCGPGQTVDMAEFRDGVWNVTTLPALTPEQIEENELMSARDDILAEIRGVQATAADAARSAATAAARALQGRPAAVVQDDVPGSPTRGTIWSIGPGGTVALNSAAEMIAQQEAGIAGELVYITDAAKLAAVKRLNGIAS